MNVCRTCLNTPADKHILDLENDCKKNFFHIMVFCLDIQVIKNSKVTMNLCNNCYSKIISFYEFKTLALKSDAYLKGMDPVTQLEDQKVSMYVDENGIKHENFLDPDEFGPSLVEDYDPELKVVIDVIKDGDVEIKVKKEEELQDLESDQENKVKNHKKRKDIKNSHKSKATIKKKRGRPKKLQSEKTKQDLQVCEECGKSVGNLKAHSVIHLQKGERQVFHCHLCPKFFITQSGYNRHQKVVHLGIVQTQTAKSICNICNKEVKHLKNHELMMHHRETLPYGCVSCKRRFFNRSALQKHMSKHGGVFDRPYECDICHKTYRFKSEVSNHIRKIHQNEKNYQCEICSRAFFDKLPFILHLETHSSVPQYKCKECGLPLKTQATLWKHQKLAHNTVRNFHCKLCTKSFKRPTCLRTHMLTHTRERPFQCPFCDLRFRRTHHLKRHQLKLHGNLKKN